jgi:hypothetical protein
MHSQWSSKLKQNSDEIPKTYDLEQSFPEITRILGIGQGKNIILQNDK